MRKRTLITASLLTWAGLAQAGLLEDAREAARLIKERTKKAEPAPAPQPNAEAPTRAGSPQKGPVAADGLDEAVYSRYDFVPGDKVIFFDDFGDTDVGEFPIKWHLKGPKDSGNNAVEVVQYQGQRFLRARPGAAGGDQPSATQYLRLVTQGDLPARFTIEFDAVLGHSQIPDYPNQYLVYLLNQDEEWLVSEGVGVGVLAFSGVGGRSANTKHRAGLAGRQGAPRGHQRQRDVRQGLRRSPTGRQRPRCHRAADPAAGPEPGCWRAASPTSA
jgi:hypothetical protein